MNRLVVILLVGLNLITLSTLTVFMVNADSFVEYFDTRLTDIDNRMIASEALDVADGQNIGMLFSNVFDALTHLHNEEVRPIYEALEPMMQGIPQDESYIRPLLEEPEKEPRPIIISAPH